MGDDEIVKLLLNSNLFSKYQNVNLIQYMLKKNKNNCSVFDTVKQNLALHTAKKDRLEDEFRHYHDHFGPNLPQHLIPLIQLHNSELETLATKIRSCEQMGIFLDHKFKNANTLNDLQRVLKLLKGQTSDQKKDGSPILYILDTWSLAGSILEFLIFDFDQNLHCLQEEKNTK